MWQEQVLTLLARGEVNELCVNESGAEESDISRVNAQVLHYTQIHTHVCTYIHDDATRK